MPQNKVSQKFFETFRIKMRGRRGKTALSSRGGGGGSRPKIEPRLNMLELFLTNEKAPK